MSKSATIFNEKTAVVETLPSGRPERQFTDEEKAKIEALARVGNSQEDIATLMDVAENTLMKHCGKLIKRGRAALKNDIKKSQYEVGIRERREATLNRMGETYCEQGSRHVHSGPGGGPLEIIVKHYADPDAA